MSTRLMNNRRNMIENRFKLKEVNLTPTLPLLGLLNKISSSIGAAPFHWNTKAGTVSPRGTCLRAYWIFSSMVLLGIQTIYVNVRLLQFVRVMNKFHMWGKMQMLIKLSILTNVSFSSMMMSVYNLNTVWNYADIIKYYNEILRFRRELAAAEVPLMKHPPMTYFMVIIVPLRALSLIVSSIQNPNDPIFLYSMFPVTWKTLWTHLLFVAVYIMFCTTYWFMLQFSITTITLNVSSIHAATKYYAVNLTKNYHADILSYKKLEVLLRLYHNASGKLALITNIVSVVFTCTLSSYGAVRFFDRVPFRLYIMFLCPMIGMVAEFYLTLPLAARIPKYAAVIKAKILSASADHRDHRLTKSVVNAMPTLGINVGHYFTIKNTTFISIMGKIVENAVTLLINF